MNYVLDKETHSIIFTTLQEEKEGVFPEYKDELQQIINVCVETESVSVALLFKDFMSLTFPDNQEFHRQGHGFPYVVYKGILILSTSAAKMKEEIENVINKNKPKDNVVHLVPNELIVSDGSREYPDVDGRRVKYDGKTKVQIQFNINDLDDENTWMDYQEYLEWIRKETNE